LFRWLKPGGRLLITDYCLGAAAATPEAQSPSFQAYLRKRGYHLQTLEAYASQLSAAGFDQVLTEDRTSELVEQLQRELARLGAAGSAAAEGGAGDGTAGATNSSSSSTDEGTAASIASWQAKLARAQAGEQLWGLIQAVKPLGQQV
jgi:phosphoethanolamine N-methyltransferase